jgi:hypothetical protein
MQRVGTVNAVAVANSMATQDSRSVNSQKLCSFDLSETECARLLDRIDALVQFLGAPGDWGYGTKLGDATLFLIDLQKAVRNEKVRN